MAKLSIVAGTTSKLVDVFVQDSSSTIGGGLTGLVFNTASLTAYYYREGAASATAITLATMTLGTWATGGFVVVDGTNMPGAYQIGVPNAAFAAGAKSVLIMLRGAANMAPVVLEVELTAVDNQSATAFITSVASVTGAVGSVTGAVGSVTGAVGSVTAGVTVTTNNDKTGYALSAAAVQAVWDALTSALTTVGSIGKLIVTNLDALISSRSTYAGGAVASVTAGVTVTTNNDKTGYALTAGEHTAVVADVNAALDAAGTELAAVPGQTATVRQSLRFLFQYFRNKRTVTASVETLFKEDSATTLGTALIADDGTTATFSKAA